MSEGRLSRASAITVPGIVLSQPDSATTASNKWPRATNSIESAITSRLIKEAFMPSVPIEMPSETAIVLYSIGVPPAARMPAFTRSAKRRRWKLQGMTSIQVLATPTSGFDKSSSVNPTAFNIARAGARPGPTSSSWLFSFSSSAMGSTNPFLFSSPLSCARPSCPSSLSLRCRSPFRWRHRYGLP